VELRRGRRIAAVSVANWFPNKGLLDLLEALGDVPSGDVTLHLVGRTDVDAEYAQRVRRRLTRPDLVDRVVVHGPVSATRVAELYLAADVFVLLSRYETYSTATAEALSAGVPVLAWRSAHIDQVVTDGVEGRLVEPGDVAGLSRALHTFATDEPRRTAWAQAAARRGARLPRWSDTADAFFDVLRGLVTEAIEPTHGPSSAVDVDAAHCSVFDEESPRDVVADTQRPRDRRLDRADVRDDDDRAGGRTR